MAMLGVLSNNILLKCIFLANTGKAGGIKVVADLYLLGACDYDELGRMTRDRIWHVLCCDVN